MQKFILAFVAIIAFSTASLAQTPSQQNPPVPPKTAQEKQPGKDMDDKNHQWLKDLGLAADQEQKYMALKDSYKADVKAVEADGALTADAKKAQITAHTEKFETSVRGIFTSEQYVKWKEMRLKKDMKKNEDKSKMDDNKQ
jgi:Spy/CpxP family protein refolding chaperone